MWPRSTSTLRHKQPQAQQLPLGLKFVLEAPARCPPHLLCQPPSRLDFQGRLKPSGPALNGEAEPAPSRLHLRCLEPVLRNRCSQWEVSREADPASHLFCEIPECCQAHLLPTHGLHADKQHSSGSFLLPPPLLKQLCLCFIQNFVLAKCLAPSPKYNSTLQNRKTKAAFAS